MEANCRWALVTAIAPVAWGSTYFVTREFLPADHPLWGAAIRALPAGLLLLAAGRALPRGAWWWRSAVLGTLNVGAFFVLVYLAATLLPTSVAATIMAVAPVPMMLIAWALLAERPAGWHLLGAALGLAGVALMLLTGAEAVPWPGVAASVAALLMSALGYVLAKRWGGRVDVLASTSWQLVAGGAMLVPAALAVEGAPPALDVPAALAFGYVTLVATAVAFAAWFSGLRRLPAGTVGLLGLLNPVTGVLLGIVVAAEPLTGRQLAGLALVLCGVLLGQPSVTARVRAGVARWASPTRAAHRDVRHAVPVVARAGRAEPEAAVEVGQVGLGVEHHRLVADLAQHRLQQLHAEAPPAHRAGGAQPADPVRPVGLLEQPQAAEHRAAAAAGCARVTAEPVVPGPRLEVAPVQLGIGAGLLDDEHVDPQPQQLVEQGGLQIGRPGPVHGRRRRLPGHAAHHVPTGPSRDRGADGGAHSG